MEAQLVEVAGYYIRLNKVTVVTKAQSMQVQQGTLNRLYGFSVVVDGATFPIFDNASERAKIDEIRTELLKKLGIEEGPETKPGLSL